MWRLAREHLGGQWRYASVPMGGLISTGFDMSAALAMARAIGIDERAVAELLPAVEAGALRKGTPDG